MFLKLLLRLATICLICFSVGSVASSSGIETGSAEETITTAGKKNTGRWTPFGRIKPKSHQSGDNRRRKVDYEEVRQTENASALVAEAREGEGGVNREKKQPIHKMHPLKILATSMVIVQPVIKTWLFGTGTAASHVISVLGGLASGTLNCIGINRIPETYSYFKELMGDIKTKKLSRGQKVKYAMIGGAVVVFVTWGGVSTVFDVLRIAIEAMSDLKINFGLASVISLPEGVTVITEVALSTNYLMRFVREHVLNNEKKEEPEEVELNAQADRDDPVELLTKAQNTIDLADANGEAAGKKQSLVVDIDNEDAQSQKTVTENARKVSYKKIVLMAICGVCGIYCIGSSFFLISIEQLTNLLEISKNLSPEASHALKMVSMGGHFNSNLVMESKAVVELHEFFSDNGVQKCSGHNKSLIKYLQKSMKKKFGECYVSFVDKEKLKNGIVGAVDGAVKMSAIGLSATQKVLYQTDVSNTVNEYAMAEVKKVCEGAVKTGVLQDCMDKCSHIFSKCEWISHYTQYQKVSSFFNKTICLVPTVVRTLLIAKEWGEIKSFLKSFFISLLHLPFRFIEELYKQDFFTLANK